LPEDKMIVVKTASFVQELESGNSDGTTEVVERKSTITTTTPMTTSTITTTSTTPSSTTPPQKTTEIPNSPSELPARTTPRFEHRRDRARTRSSLIHHPDNGPIPLPLMKLMDASGEPQMQFDEPMLKSMPTTMRTEQRLAEPRRIPLAVTLPPVAAEGINLPAPRKNFLPIRTLAPFYDPRQSSTTARTTSLKALPALGPQRISAAGRNEKYRLFKRRLKNLIGHSEGSVQQSLEFRCHSHSMYPQHFPAIAPPRHRINWCLFNFYTSERNTLNGSEATTVPQYPPSGEEIWRPGLRLLCQEQLQVPLQALPNDQL
jgi:hypothetical protein